MVKRGLPVCVLTICLGALAVADERVTAPFVGITYIDRSESTPRPVHMHVVQIDLTAPGLRFKVTPPSGSRETTRQTTLQFLEAEGAQVAINAHFFLPFPSSDTEAWVIGLAASEGRVYSSFEAPQQSFAIVADAAALNIDAENRAAIVHHSPGHADETRVLEPVTLWNAVAGSAQIVTGGVATIPRYTDETHPEAALVPGGSDNNQYSNDRSWYAVATARSAAGLSRDGRTLTLFTVDVRGSSEGMTVGEVAATLIADYGVWDALNLDGGGSTSLALEDPWTNTASLVNTSSDNVAGRSVGSNLAVFARRRER